METWLAENAVNLIASLSAFVWFLIKLGEWKALREERERRRADAEEKRHKADDSTAVVASTALQALEERLLRVIADATRHGTHDAFQQTAALIGQLEARFEKAGEKSSELASYVQALPTRADLDAFLAEFNRHRDEDERVHREMTHVMERVARLER